MKLLEKNIVENLCNSGLAEFFGQKKLQIKA